MNAGFRLSKVTLADLLRQSVCNRWLAMRPSPRRTTPSRPDVPIDQFAKDLGPRGSHGHQSFDAISRMKKLGWIHNECDNLLVHPRQYCQTLTDTRSASRVFELCGSDPTIHICGCHSVTQINYVPYATDTLCLSI